MIEFSGIITEGEKSASGKSKNWNGYGSIYHQINFIKKESSPSFFEKISNCKMATINIILTPDLSIKKYKYIFEKVFWLPNSDTWYEKISFIPILLIHNNNTIQAWIYKPDKSPHKNRKNFIEVIAPEIKELKYNDICKIKIGSTYLK